MMHTSQQSSEVVAAAAVADFDAPEVGAAGTGACLFSSSSSLLLLLLLLSTRGCMSADRMADCTQKLQAALSAAVESRQTGFNSLIVQHVRFFLGPTDVQAVAICLIWCRVARSRDVRSRDFSAPCVKCKTVSRFKNKLLIIAFLEA